MRRERVLDALNFKESWKPESIIAMYDAAKKA